MLSRNDIANELGKNVAIFPFHFKNFKENSINLTLSKNAWALNGGEYTLDEIKKYITETVSNGNKKAIGKGGNAVIEVEKEKYVILLPNQTTIVETAEVIGVGNCIGGTLHSKVGVVALGVGHIGTMLGPGYCGHLMISLHNTTNKPIALKCGDTFVSITLYYLKTPVERTSATVSGHVDKLSELGINVSKTTREYLTNDWKSNLPDIIKNMEKSREYIEFVSDRKKERKKSVLKIFNKKNIFLLIAYLAIFGIAFVISKKMDADNNSTIWVERFWNILSSSIIIPIIMASLKLFKNK